MPELRMLAIPFVLLSALIQALFTMFHTLRHEVERLSSVSYSVDRIVVGKDSHDFA